MRFTDDILSLPSDDIPMHEPVFSGRLRLFQRSGRWVMEWNFCHFEIVASRYAFLQRLAPKAKEPILLSESTTSDTVVSSAFSRLKRTHVGIEWSCIALHLT